MTDSLRGTILMISFLLTLAVSGPAPAILAAVVNR